MNTFHVGFTGTRNGGTKEQKKTLDDMLKAFSIVFGRITVHHGDCIGADTELDSLAKKYDFFVALHPPDNDSRRSFCQADYEETPKPYLERNKDIVDASEFLIAVPETNEEKIRSGTWSTINYANKNDKVVYTIYTDGSVHHSKKGDL